MNYKDLLKETKEKNPKKVYLFRGEEEYLMDSFIEKISKTYIGDGFKTLNQIEIRKTENMFDHVLNACETLPVGSDRKLVIIKELEDIIKKDSKSITDLGDYILDLGDYIILIIKDEKDSLRRNTRLYKNIRAMNGVVEFDKLNHGELSNWIAGKIKREGKTISRDTMNYLIRVSTYTEYRSEKSLYELKNELLKILDHSGSEVQRKDIDAVLIEDVDTNIFSLLDSIVMRNTGKALEVFNDMDRLNEPLPRILYMITRQFRLLLKYKIYLASGYNNKDIRDRLSISQFEYNKIKGNSRRYREDELIMYLNYILDIDRRLKTEDLDEKLAIEMLIVELTK